MDNIGYISLSNAAMIERANDVSTNNIANANTAGFRAAQSVFEEMVVKTESGSAVDEMSYALDKGTYTDNSQGAVTATGNQLDVALQGDGWFGYQLENGENAIGRDGSFSLTPQGELVTTAGLAVLDNGGAPIALPADGTSISIATDGTVSSSTGEVLAQIGVFEAPAAATYGRKPGGMLQVPDGEWPLVPSLNTTVLQGFTEQSNVNPIIEMTRMIALQRSYERTINMADNANKLRTSTIDRLGRNP